MSITAGTLYKKMKGLASKASDNTLSICCVDFNTLLSKFKSLSDVQVHINSGFADY